MQEEETFRRVVALETEGSDCAAAAGAGDEDLALVLRVEVDEVVACHESGLHADGTRELRLLIACEDTLDGSVLNVVGGEDGELDGIAYTVVGTECRPLGVQPVAVDIGLDGVLGEVEVYIHELVADHVHVALQNCRGTVLKTLRGGLADKHVAGFVDFRLQTVTLAKVLEIFNHLLLMLRWAGYFVDSRELFKYAGGFQFCHILFSFNNNIL